MRKKHLQKNHQQPLIPGIDARSLVPDDAKSRSVLKERAELLARREQEQQSTTSVQYLRFRLGPTEWYGIPYQWLLELLYEHGIVPVPGTPGFVAGVVNHRGELLTVLNLHQFFHTQEAESGDEARILVVRNETMKLGLVVDEVAGNEDYDPGGLAPPLASEGVARIEYVAGIHRGEVTMLDLQALLADPGIIVDYTAT